MYGAEGRTAYTESVSSIMCLSLPGQTPRLTLRPRQSETDNHRNCPQTKYMNAQNVKSGSKYSVPVQNRFQVLGN